MPKMKTVKSAAKRFAKTGKGGFKRSHSHKRHILTKMTRAIVRSPGYA